MEMENHMDWRRPFGRRRMAAPEIKDSRAGPLIALTSAGRPRWTPRDYAHLADEGFGKNAVAYRCVRMIAEAAASTPLMVMVAGVRTTEHPLARFCAALAHRPVTALATEGFGSRSALYRRLADLRHRAAAGEVGDATPVADPGHVRHQTGADHEPRGAVQV